jgi:hypothetical protein
MACKTGMSRIIDTVPKTLSLIEGFSSQAVSHRDKSGQARMYSER